MNIYDKALAKLDGEIGEALARRDRLAQRPPSRFTTALVDDADETIAQLQKRRDRLADAVQMAEVNQIERFAGPARAKAYAERLAVLIKAQPGAPQRLNVWHKAGYDTRVYFPAKFGWISVGYQGELDGTSLTGAGRVRSTQTLADSSLYPPWRKAVRAGIAAYYDELRGADDDG